MFGSRILTGRPSQPKVGTLHILCPGRCSCVAQIRPSGQGAVAVGRLGFGIELVTQGVVQLCSAAMADKYGCLGGLSLGLSWGFWGRSWAILGGSWACFFGFVVLS